LESKPEREREREREREMGEEKAVTLVVASFVVFAAPVAKQPFSLRVQVCVKDNWIPLFRGNRMSPSSSVRMSTNDRHLLQ
jgi:hypothetical protein